MRYDFFLWGGEGNDLSACVLANMNAVQVMLYLTLVSLYFRDSSADEVPRLKSGIFLLTSLH